MTDNESSKFPCYVCNSEVDLDEDTECGECSATLLCKCGGAMAGDWAICSFCDGPICIECITKKHALQSLTQCRHVGCYSPEEIEDMQKRRHYYP